MHKSVVISHFDNVSETARAISVSQAAVSKWGAIIPEKQAFRIERITRGKLKYDASLYEKPA